MASIDPVPSTRQGGTAWRRRLERQLLVVTSALVCAFTLPAAAATDVQTHVRSTDGPTLELIEEGITRSATFRTLVAEINDSDGIVYVERAICAFGHVNGCVLPFIAPTQGHRFRRILVTPDKYRVSHDQGLALIAHELQHAREVIRHENVIDVADGGNVPADWNAPHRPPARAVDDAHITLKRTHVFWMSEEVGEARTT